MKISKNIRKMIAEINPEALCVDGHDDAIIGIDDNLCVVYDKDKIISKLRETMYEDFEAEEYFDYNIGCAYLGEYTPIYITVFGNE